MASSPEWQRFSKEWKDPCWDVHILCELYSHRFGLELAPRLVCLQGCAGRSSGLWLLCGAWCWGDGLCCPTAPHPARAGSLMCPFPALWRGALPRCPGEKEEVRHEWNCSVQGDEFTWTTLPPALQVGLVHRWCPAVWGRIPGAQPAGGQPASRGLSVLREQPWRLPQRILTAWWICDTSRNGHHEGLDASWREGFKQCVWKERSYICGVRSNCL